MDRRIISDVELHAYIDGELEQERARVVAAEVAASVELSALVAQYKADRDLIMRTYGPLIEHPLPAGLIESFVRASTIRQAPRRARFFAAATAMAALIVAGWIGFALLADSRTESIVAEAMAARDGRVHYEREANAAELQDRDASGRILRSAIDAPIQVPNLEKAGYRLAAIDVYPGRSGKHALQLSYRDAGNNLFTLYIRAPGGPDRFDLKQRGKMAICIWRNDDLNVAMLGEMSQKEMLRIATLTYGDLNF